MIWLDIGTSADLHGHVQIMLLLPALIVTRGTSELTVEFLPILHSPQHTWLGTPVRRPSLLEIREIYKSGCTNSHHGKGRLM
jgi:hypothetical protein